MKKNLTHTGHILEGLYIPEHTEIIKNGERRLKKIGSTEIPADTLATIPYGAYHIHLRHGSEHLTIPPPTDIKGVNGSNLIVIECHLTSERAKAYAQAAKTVMGESPGVYHISHGTIYMSGVHENQITLKAVEKDAKFSRSYASDTSDSGSDTDLILRSEDRRQIIIRRTPADDLGTGELSFDFSPEAFSQSRINALSNDFPIFSSTTAERKAARAKRREKKLQRK